ncbi:MAG: hypothetical protein AB7U83_17025 [Vicinamibacterales bacterium]
MTQPSRAEPVRESPPTTPFAETCSAIGELVAARPAILAHAGSGRDLAHGLQRLREGMRRHVWHVGGRAVDLGEAIAWYDARTRDEGLHALNDWDGVADAVNAETIAVDVLDFVMRQRGAEPPHPVTLAVLLDYYLMYLLALLSLRVWDDGAAGANLARLESLLAAIQGPGGSGQRFCDDAEALMLVATAHYELQEHGYDLLLERVRTLEPARRTRVALQHAAAMGCHLRFGFEATYARDTIRMRDDNVADYPWLCFAVAGAIDEYVRLTEAGAIGAERDRVIEALLNGLTADARAFVGAPITTLRAHEAERQRARDQLLAWRGRLREEFEPFRPTSQAYSPLSFFFNFSHNVLKGTVVDALLRRAVWPLSLNDLFTALPDDPAVSEQKTRLATTLMGYARSSPQTIRGRLMPVIVYDPSTGREAFGNTMRKLME